MSRVDLVVLGGGLGGVAAALAAVRRGLVTVLVEETDWIGGQLTTEAVPPDEHPWIESFGSTATYRELRRRIREYYRAHYPLTEDARGRVDFNPGGATVSKLAHEPKVAAAVLDSMVAPLESSGRLRILRNHQLLAAAGTGDYVESVLVQDQATGRELELRAGYFVDATPKGDLLELAGIEYVTGAEGQDETGEPHAPKRAQPSNMQAFSVCFAIDHLAGQDNRIDKPAGYDAWRTFVPTPWSVPLLGLESPSPRTLKPASRSFSPNPDGHPGDVVADQSLSGGDDDLWVFRRILARKNFRPGAFESDIVLVNWPHIDYMVAPLFGPGVDGLASLEAARDLSRSVMYWLQNDVPRADGGTGWPGLRFRGDVLGTGDGLAKAPYIREGRRIKALTTIREQDVSREFSPKGRPHRWPDSVGVGAYRIDLHPSTGGDDYIDIASVPFEIPLGSLIPQRVRNVMAGARNIGTTHITNGCYRVHPVEWNVGEAAGELVAFCLAEGTEPHAVHGNEMLTSDLQRRLTEAGIEIAWPTVRGY